MTSPPQVDLVEIHTTGVFQTPVSLEVDREVLAARQSELLAELDRLSRGFFFIETGVTSGLRIDPQVTAVTVVWFTLARMLGDVRQSAVGVNIDFERLGCAEHHTQQKRENRGFHGLFLSKFDRV